MSKRWIADIETDGLLDQLTKVHCLVLRDLDTNEVVSCTDDSAGYHPISYGLSLLSEAERTYWHNGIGFDIPALKKLYPDFKPGGTAMDTYVIAAMRWAHIKDDDFKQVKLGKFPAQFAGRHSLEAWGYRLGKRKTEYKKWCADNGIDEPFAVWRPEMQSYCVDDTDTTRDLVLHIRYSGVSPEAVETELELRAFLVKMEENGWPFDVQEAVKLQAQWVARREELADLLRIEFGSWFASNGTTTPVRDIKSRGVYKDAPYTKLKTVEFNPGSRDHIALCLKRRYGWQPDTFTSGGKPQVDESSLKGMNYPPVKVLQEYLLVEKRLSQLAEGSQAWLRQTRSNAQTGLQHIHARVNQNATITHRAAHSNPNISAVPKVGKPFGAECRALFTVPDGWILIGADASGLEARCLGHYVSRYDGGAYAKLLLEGDIHTANRKALGLPEGKGPRDRAKTWYYAWMFGAGDEKLGKTHSPDAPASTWKKLGARLKKMFLEATPALKYLIDAIRARTKDTGYILGLDGRRVYVRSDHSILNTLIQSAGAVVTKRWVVLVNREMTARFGPQGWDGKWAALAYIHDELEIAVRPEIREETMHILISTLESLTQHFNFRCPLTGESASGRTWRDVH